MKTRTWIIIIAALFLVMSMLSIFLFKGKTIGTIANVYVDGECVYSVDLSIVTSAYTKEIKTENGANLLLIEPSRISISEADCPDKVCVKSGWISNSTAPIVCLPHRLVIKIEKEAPGELLFDSVVK